MKSLLHNALESSAKSNVATELDRLVSDAQHLGEEDGRRCALTHSGVGLRAEVILRGRAQRLLGEVSRHFDTELARRRLQASDVLAQHERRVGELPEALRKAKRVFDEHHARNDTHLMEAARRAEAEQRELRAEQMRAGRVFRAESSGARAMMMATMFVAVTLETALSTTLLADFHPGGHLGAAGLCATLSILNLAFCFSAGRALRVLFNREGGWRVLGTLSGILTGLTLVGFHFTVASLRQQTQIADSFGTAMRIALQATLHDPPTEFASLLMGLLGLGCGAAALMLGYGRATHHQRECEAEVAARAEHALHVFRTVRARYESLDGVVARASAILDAIDREVSERRTALGSAFNEWQTCQNQQCHLQTAVDSGYRLAVRTYRAYTCALKSNPDAARAEPPSEALEAPRFGGGTEIRPTPDETGEAIQAALTSSDWTRALDAARQEIDRACKAAAQRIAERIAAVEGTVYSDWYRPADASRPRAALAQVVPVDMRRAEL